MKKIEGKELFIRTKIKNSPIVIVNDTEKEIYFGTMGEYKISENYKTLEEAKENSNTITWDKLTLLIHLLMESYTEIKKTNEP